MHLRARYGHGGRLGYDREWARTAAATPGGVSRSIRGCTCSISTHWLAGALPLHSALLRTQFWNTPVDDNAALILGKRDDRTSAWAMLHVSWTEWKNTFSLKVDRRTAKLQVEGLAWRAWRPDLVMHRAPNGGIAHDADPAAHVLHLADNAVFGHALARLFEATHDVAYRDAAEQIVDVMQRELYVPRRGARAAAGAARHPGDRAGACAHPPALIPIVARFTGEQTCAQIAREVSAEVGQPIPTASRYAITEKTSRAPIWITLTAIFTPVEPVMPL